ncbi:MAG: MFS transporter, partial [Calditrichaeota bacterium]
MIGRRGANSIRSNLWKILFLQAMNWFLLIMPTLVLFFNENGMTLSQVMILQAIFSMSLIAFEVPSGYFSDVVGRRYTLVISTILNSVGLLFMSLSGTFMGFMIAELLLGMSASFVSGTDSALLYDTLESLQRTEEYTKYQGILSSISHFSETLAAIMGGWLAALSLRLPLYVETVLVALTIPVSLMLIEPERKPRNRRAGLADIIQIAKFALAEHKVLKGFITYSSFIASATFTVVWLIQPAVAEAGLPIYW